jgi:hypothetical protein
VVESDLLDQSERQAEETRSFEEHLASKADVTANLESVLRSLFEQHRQEFVNVRTTSYLAVPQDFLTNRKPNESVEDYYKRTLKWPDKKDQSGEAQDHRARILERVRYVEGFVIWLTTHPDVRSKRPVAGFWKDNEGRLDWIDNPNKKPFKVRLKPDAEALARKQAERDAEAVLKLFLNKTFRKLLAILQKSGNYYAHLVAGRFADNAIEGDVRVTFVDTKSFVIHVAIKYNVSGQGTPYVQYPLTFTDVYAGAGVRPAKSQSQADVEELFGVTDEDRWQPPVPESRLYRWPAAVAKDKARAGDVVKFQGKRLVGLLLGKDRKNEGNLRTLLANGKQASVPRDEIEAIVCRIEVGRAGSDSFYYNLLNNDRTKSGRQNFLKPASRRLEKLYHGVEKGNHKIEGARIAFEVLCSRDFFPGSRKREAVPA